MTNYINKHMNRNILMWCILLCSLSIAFTGCQKVKDRFSNKPQYKIELSNGSLYITIPWYEPITYSAVVYPSNFNIDEVIKDTFSTLKNSHKNGATTIYVILYSKKLDKYGNDYIESSLFNLMKVDIREVKKYHNYIYFENEYDLEGKIRVLHNYKPLQTIRTPIK